VRRDPSLFTRLRWRLADLRAEQDARVVVGLVVLVLLAVGGVAAARAVARASSDAPAGVSVVTIRHKVRVRVHGRLVTRWRTRKVYARAQTVLQTHTIHTPGGLRVVTHPVVRYRITYRKRVVTKNGTTRTVLQPVTSAQTITNTRTQLVTSTRRVTDKEVTTVTQPVTTTVVSTETDTVGITVTVTVPTVTIP
jgi:hypothetical protein